ncbi:MAG: HAMP domain-containing histidine kinase [Prevotella sp.]|nr:HAMP domain-containing histidine kinase [Prevotella sp.]
MLQQLYYSIGREQILDILIWAFLIGGLLALAVMLYWQVKQSKVLNFELSQLEKVKKHNVEYDFILKAMHLAVWHVDTQSESVTYEKDFREKVDGFTPASETSLKDMLAYFDEEDRQNLSKALNDIMEGKTDSFHETYRNSSWYSGDKYWTEGFATVAERDAEGRPLKLVGASMRIDKRKEMEEALVEARNRAEESDRLKSAFLANMSHEIRTPLNAIIGFTSVLPDVEDNDERKMLLNLIHENTQKLLHIVDDVVNISKVETGKLELVMMSFDLNNELTVQADAVTKDVKPDVTVSTSFANESQYIMTDHKCLVEILQHYLSNAAKFTDAGSIVVGYDQPNEGRIRIWIKDTGKGIPENLQQRVFERFFKVDEFVPGAGLGLSICQTLAYSLGGKVGVQSVLGEGSTFWVEIPIQ